MADNISARRAFVVGWPVKHSRSPLIHGHWLEKHGLRGSYGIAEVAPDDFTTFIANLKTGEAGYIGGNVTIPHKEAAFALADWSDPLAREIGAVNTLWREDGRIKAMNTDGFGFVANLDALAPGWDKLGNGKGGIAVIFGAGGASRAVIQAVRDRGFREIHVVNRTVERARSLADHFGPRVHAHGSGALREVMAGADLFVNTTALGMDGAEVPEIDFSPLRQEAVVTDIVYTPLVTPILSMAARQGFRTVDGLGMLLHQAAPGFEKWFGVMPSVTSELRALIVSDLGACDMILIGLTGSIGMGKSTTATMFAARGVPVTGSDDVVHALYAGRAAPLIEAAFPGVTGNGVVDREKLARAVLDDREALLKLEAIVHPLVREEQEAFVERARREGVALALLDIPLLFESGGEKRVDAVVVVTCDPDIQKARVLARPGMTQAKFDAILARQVPDAEKRRRADFIIDTGKGLEAAEASVDRIIDALKRRAAQGEG